MINEGGAPWHGAEHEGCATAIGPGAAIALARPDGTVGRYSATVADSALGCPVTVIDGGQVVESGSGLLNSPTRVDTFAGGVLERVGDRATVLVQGVSEPPGGTPYLAVSMVDGPATGARPAPALLTVYSDPLGRVVRLLDVPSTLLAAVGAPEPAEFSGAPISWAARVPPTRRGPSTNWAPSPPRTRHCAAGRPCCCSGRAVPGSCPRVRCGGCRSPWPCSPSACWPWTRRPARSCTAPARSAPRRCTEGATTGSATPPSPPSPSPGCG